MRTQVERLREKLGSRIEQQSDLSPLAERLASLLRQHGTLSVAEALEATGANRNTLKEKFGELVEAGVAELHGKGRGSHYRQVR